MDKLFSFCSVHIIKNSYFQKCLGSELGKNSFSLFILTTAKEHDLNKLSELRTISNIINPKKKENPLELKHSGGRALKLIKCGHSKILKNID